MLDPSGKKDKLIVFRSQVRQVRINEFIKIFSISGLEIGQAHFAFAYFGRIVLERFHQGRVTNGKNILQTFYLALAKQVAAVNDLLDGLVKVNGQPLVFSPFAAGFSFEYLADAIGIVLGLDPGISLGTEAAVINDGFSGRHIIGEMGMHIHGAVGIAFNLDHDAV